ncbi:hypothetical protein ACS0Y7_33140 [Burkholderia gladioli]|uniref:hypothetical protein n=1 Tax=Burkholderia gladioli TaxID=28095 RepID=UPI003F7B0B02
MFHVDASHLRSFGQLVALEAARGLDLLKAIDDSIYAVSKLRGQAEGFAGEAAELIQMVKRINEPFDQDGAILRKLESARDSLHSSYLVVKEGRDVVARATSLKPEDGLVEAHDSLLDAIASAHNLVNELCWEVGEKSAEFSTVLEGEFSSASDFLASLRG